MTTETETKHTPGPWVVDDSLAHAGMPLVRAAAGYEIVAEPNGTLLEWPANTRLIAAAPEMLAALTEVKLHLVLARAFIEKGGVTWHDEAIATIDAALVKAAGEQP